MRDLTDKALLVSWGDGGEGQLGLGDTGYRSIPTVVDRDRNGLAILVSSVSCATNHTAACGTNGVMYLWGSVQPQLPLNLPAAHSSQVLPNRELFGAARDNLLVVCPHSPCRLADCEAKRAFLWRKFTQ